MSLSVSPIVLGSPSSVTHRAPPASTPTSVHTGDHRGPVFYSTRRVRLPGQRRRRRLAVAAFCCSFEKKKPDRCIADDAAARQRVGATSGAWSPGGLVRPHCIGLLDPPSSVRDFVYSAVQNYGLSSFLFFTAAARRDDPRERGSEAASRSDGRRRMRPPWRSSWQRLGGRRGRGEKCREVDRLLCCPDALLGLPKGMGKAPVAKATMPLVSQTGGDDVFERRARRREPFVTQNPL